MKIAVVNGPNLNLLGNREPETYGAGSYQDLADSIEQWARRLGHEVTISQHNLEGDVVDAVHEAASVDGLIINPGAFTHTSRAVADAIAALSIPVIEVHISDITSREPWRSHSVLDGLVTRTIVGRGRVGYRDAIRLLHNLQAAPVEIRYGPHRENVADLRHSPGATQLVVLVHGGFWMNQWARDTVDTMAVDLYQRGIATLNLEYRRNGAGGAWPGSGHDVQMAFDHLQHTNLVGLDTTWMGHSAGGYLSLWLSQRRPIPRVIGLASITDLAAIERSDQPTAALAREVLAQGAPERVIGRGEITLIHGVSDQVVDVEQSGRSEGARVVTLEGLGHFELLDPRRAHWSHVLEAIGGH